jgi:hypothetical protein
VRQRTNLDILCMYGRRRKFAHVPAMDGALAVEAFQAALAAGEPITLVLVCSLALLWVRLC